MKTNYNELMKQEISKLTSRPKMLLHVCCAPCSSGVLDKLTDFDITLYYYNPNTYPEEEYDLRFKQFEKLSSLPIVKCEYNHNEFLKQIIGLEQESEGGARCEQCILIRLIESFKYAEKNNFDYITTTLSISPHKDAEFINCCGKALEKQFNVKYLYADFKKENGFLESIKISKNLDLYRQDYCGCEFSITKKED